MNEQFSASTSERERQRDGEKTSFLGIQDGRRIEFHCVNFRFGAFARNVSVVNLLTNSLLLLFTLMIHFVGFFAVSYSSSDSDECD